MPINAYQEGAKVNIGVNERVFKNLGTYWNIRHRWFQLVSISFSLAEIANNSNLSNQIKLRVLGRTVDYKLSIFPPGYVGEIPAHNTTVSSVNADSVIVTSCDVTLWHYDVMMTSSVTIPPVSVICSSRNCREYVWHEIQTDGRPTLTKTLLRMLCE